MATINVEKLNLTGSELLLDEESFFNDLSDEKLEQTHGGSTPATVYVVIAVGAAAFGYNVGRNER